MPLTADQQAMLQLLLERGQSYGDLASVLGVAEAEVRSRARAALTELGGTDPDREVGLTDYLLGQADPIGRADAVRHLKDDPADLALAGELSQKLLLVAPEAALPRLPGEERRPRPRRPARTPGAKLRIPVPRRERRTDGSEGAPRTTLARRQVQLITLIGCAVVLIVAGVLALTGTFSGGSDETTAATTGGSQRLASVKLTPPAGGSASGSATFGLTGDSQLYVDVTLRGLDPPSKRQAYVMWFLLTPSLGYPVPSALDVSRKGSFEDRITIPAAEIPIAQRAKSLDVSLAPVDAVQAVIKAAFQRGRLVRKPGSTVLSGTIPASRTGPNG